MIDIPCPDCKGKMVKRFFKINDNTPVKIDMSEFPDNLPMSDQIKKLGIIDLKSTSVCVNPKCSKFSSESGFLNYK